MREGHIEFVQDPNSGDHFFKARLNLKKLQDRHVCAIIEEVISNMAKTITDEIVKNNLDKYKELVAPEKVVEKVIEGLTHILWQSVEETFLKKLEMK